MIRKTLEKRFTWVIATYILVYTVGFIGLNSGWSDLFIDLTPVNLLFTATLLFMFHGKWDRNFVFLFLLIPIAGFFLEVIGTTTGIIFGQYWYGETLGIKFLHTPLMIGVNWLILIYSVGQIAARIKAPILVKSLLGGLLMVLIDFAIEPIAMRYDFWQWENGKVPVQNYLAWFVISLFLLLAYFALAKDQKNRMAPWVYVVLLLFFAGLNLF
jgi:putative membrane protein